MKDSLSSFDWDYPEPYLLEQVVGAEVIDGLQHANNSAYVTWCEAAAWAHSQKLGISLADYQSLDRAMAIRHTEYDYLLAAYEGEQLCIGTWLVGSDDKLRMERHFQIVRVSDGATLLRSQWQLVCIQISSGRPKRMPAQFLECYGGALVSKTA